MHAAGPAARARRARHTLVLAALALGTVVATAGLAAGQEGEDATSSTTSAPPTTTEAPPTTVVLEDGDFGVVPPGATPGQPGVPAPPPEGEQPPEAGQPPEGGQPPAEGELPVPEELPVVILPDPTPGLNAALAAIDVTAAERRLLAAGLPVLVAHERTDAARTAWYTSLDERRRATEQAVKARSRLDALAVNALMYGDPAGLEPIAGFVDLADLRDRALRDVVAEHVDGAWDAAVARLATAIESERAATLELVAAERAAHGAERAHLEARADLERAIAEANDARRQLGPTILGPTVLETADLVAWYHTFYAADPPMAPIVDIIDTYLRVGAEEGITGDIAFAQAILETGGFRSGHAQGFNFAGIGAYDHCAPTCGFRFASLEAGVRAHIHLLRAYADPTVTSAQLAAAPDARVTPERVGVRGCCERWTALTGVWATDPNYDRKVLGIYRLMVETARSLDRQQQ